MKDEVIDMLKVHGEIYDTKRDGVRYKVTSSSKIIKMIINEFFTTISIWNQKLSVLTQNFYTRKLD